MSRAAVVLLVVPVVLAACGGGTKHPTGSSTALGDIEAAALKTMQAGTEHLALRATASSGNQTVVLSGPGAFDTKSGQGSMHVNLAVGTLTAPLDEVLDGTDAYIRSPLLTAALPAGKKWLKVDLAKAGAAAGFNLSVLGAQDPGKALSYLRNLKDVTVVGKETVGGVSTTHYRAVAAGSATYDAWVGDDGYIHRIRVVSTSGAKVSATTDLSRFGSTVHVKVPSAAESYATNSIPGMGG